MDIRYRISGGLILGSAPTPLVALPLDSKAVLSESEILTTQARGSCGVDPGPVRLRILVTLSALPIGNWLYGVRKRLMFVWSSMFSACAMLRFTALAVLRRGGGTDLALMRPRKGSLGAAVFEGIAPSSAKIR